MTEFDPYPKDFIPISKVWFLCIRVISSDIWSFFRSIMIYSQIPSDLDPRRTSGISKCDPAIPERGSQPAQTAASSTLSASHTKVGSLSDPPGYVNQVPPLSVPTSSVYSSPPALPTPVTLNPTAPPLLQVGFPAFTNLVPTTSPPAASQGYVTFNSAKSTGTTEAASPGYITLSQLSPNKEVVESKENGNLSPNLPTATPGLGSPRPALVTWPGIRNHLLHVLIFPLQRDNGSPAQSQELVSATLKNPSWPKISTMKSHFVLMQQARKIDPAWKTCLLQKEMSSLQTILPFQGTRFKEKQRYSPIFGLSNIMCRNHHIVGEKLHLLVKNYTLKCKITFTFNVY